MIAPVGLFDFKSYESLVNTLLEVLERDKEDIQSALFYEALETGTNVRQAAEEFGITPHVYNDVMTRFYSETDAFVLELAVVHMREACKEIDRRVIQAVSNVSDGKRILCLGDGIGTDSLRFAGAGFDTLHVLHSVASHVLRHPAVSKRSTNSTIFLLALTIYLFAERYLSMSLNPFKSLQIYGVT